MVYGGSRETTTEFGRRHASGQANTPWRPAEAGTRITHVRRRRTHLQLPLPSTTHLFLALFLLVFGLNLLFGLAIPMWVTGLLAVIAGTLLVTEHFRLRVGRK